MNRENMMIILIDMINESKMNNIKANYKFINNNWQIITFFLKYM